MTGECSRIFVGIITLNTSVLTLWEAQGSDLYFYHLNQGKLKHYLFLQMRKQIQRLLNDLSQIMELVRSTVGIQIQVSLGH